MFKKILDLFKKKEIKINVPDGYLEYIDMMSKQINGDLRGGINQKTKELNLVSIKWFVTKIFTEVYSLGVRDGYAERIDEKLKTNGTG